MEALFNDELGVLIIRPDDEYTPESSIVVHGLPTFVEAWKALNAQGYDCSGWKRQNLGDGSWHNALVATDLEACVPPTEPYEV